ncbi:MAG TPA: hypothetical protein VF082_12670 [Jiangellaceae bacterium]
MKSTTVYASAARTATPTAATVAVGRYNYLRLVIDVTAITATPSVVCTIDALSPLSGKYHNLLTSAALTESGVPYTRVLQIGPGLPVTANLSANGVLPDTIRITMTHGDADSITYSVAAELMD